MSYKELIIIALSCTLSCIASARPTQEIVPDSGVLGPKKQKMVLFFRFDRSLVDSGYRNNRHVLASLHELFADSLSLSRIDSVHISAFSSPDGNAVYNRRLALKRARAVKGYLVWKYPRLHQNRIQTSAHVENWNALGAVVENDPGVPHREEVLGILAGNHSGNDSGDRIAHRLKKLHGGAAYRYILRHLLPELRNASVCTVFIRPMKHPGSGRPADLSLSHTRTASALVAVAPTLPAATADSASYSAYLGEMSRLAPLRIPVLALKTNLLFDAALMPNVEVEVPLGKRWSLNGELMFPWWKLKGDKYCLQILMGGLEGRYWLGQRERYDVLTGHFLGLYAGGGKYDLQWKRDGYQGEFFIAAGISYGYAHRIARNLRLEYNIGVGLLRTDYRYYHARDNYQTLLWQENGRYTWLGPTKLKISLVWLLSRKKAIE